MMESIAPVDDRMTRNATSLAASSIITAVLGLVFWAVAARVLSTNEVGVGTAIVTSIVLLANLATLGLRNGLIRFMTASGSSAERFVATAYALSASVAVVFAVVYVLGTQWWAEDLIVLREHPLDAVAFAAACAVWTIFVLQDSVLTGLRQAIWIPIENLGYSVAKLVLLVVLVPTGAWALPIAWCVPALVAIVPVSVLVFRRLLPAVDRPPADPEVFNKRTVARFSLGDQFADVLRLLGAEVVVLVVLAKSGAVDTAFAFYAMTIAATGQLVPANIVTAFVAEASARAGDTVELARRAATHSLAFIVPGSLFGVAAAPLVLRMFGQSYADNGTTLLRLLSLDAIPVAVIGVALGWARVERNIWLIIRIAGGIAAAPLLGVLVFERWWGINAIGWVSLMGHSALAALLTTTTLRPLWSGVVGGSVSDWLLARRRHVRRSRRSRSIAAVFDELDARQRDGMPLTPRRLLASDNDVAVVKVEHPQTPRIVKVALSERAARGLDQHVAALDAVRRSAVGRSDVLAFLPEVLELGDCEGHRYVIETACSGVVPLAADHAVVVSIAHAVTAVHGLDAEVRELDQRLLDELVTARINVLMSDRRLWKHVGEIQRLWSVLCEGLDGHRAVVGRTNGDCWIGNALVQREGSTTKLSGLVDWEDSRAVGLPVVDLAHLWLSAQNDEIGIVAVEAVNDGVGWGWADDLEVAISDRSLPGELVLLLAWLHHVASGLARAERFALSGRWLSTNVVPVLELVPVLESLDWARSTQEVQADDRGTTS